MYTATEKRLMDENARLRRKIEFKNNAAWHLEDKLKAAIAEYDRAQAALEAPPSPYDDVPATLAPPTPGTKPEPPPAPPTRTIRDSSPWDFRKEKPQNKLGKLYEQREWTIEVANNLEALYGDRDSAVNLIIGSIRQYADDLILRKP